MSLTGKIAKRFLKHKYTSDGSSRHHLVERDGASYLLDRQNSLDRRLLLKKGYEEALVERAVRLINERKLSHFIDVGANFGLYTIAVGTRTKADIHAFEPVKRNYNQLSGNIFVNELDRRVTAYRTGASNDEGEATIHIAPQASGWSRLDVSDTAAERLDKFTEQEQIQLSRIDNLMRLKGEHLFIKVDVEGHELAALQGMRSLLENNDACLQVEIWLTSDNSDIIDYMSQVGYVKIEQVEDNFFFERMKA